MGINKMFLGYQLDNFGNKFIAMVADSEKSLREIEHIKFTEIVQSDENFVLYQGKYLSEKDAAEKKKQDEKNAKIQSLKDSLNKTDYLAIKYAEGVIPIDQYLPIANQRQVWRDEINQLQENKI